MSFLMLFLSVYLLVTLVCLLFAFYNLKASSKKSTANLADLFNAQENLSSFEERLQWSKGSVLEFLYIEDREKKYKDITESYLSKRALTLEEKLSIVPFPVRVYADNPLLKSIIETPIKAWKDEIEGNSNNDKKTKL